MTLFRYQENFAKCISAALILMYALVPWYLDRVGIYNVPWGKENLLYSVSFSIIILWLPVGGRGDSGKVQSDLSLAGVAVLFLVCAITFSFFPWISDRESLGASLSAFFRACWLLCTFASVSDSEFRKFLMLVLTALLVFVDQSRTYFFVSFLVLAISSRYLFAYLATGLVATLVVAAARVNEGISGFDMLIYGVVGEGYNGAKAVGQVLEVTGLKVNWVAHVLHTIGQPLVFPFEFIFGRILGVDFPAQASYFSDLVLDELGEVLSPMGGWYILADFIYYGWAGVGLLAIYEWIAWRVSKYLLDTDYFPFGSYVFLISIKATPYIYYKFLFYIFIISFCFGWCRRGWVNFGRAMRVRIV